MHLIQLEGVSCTYGAGARSAYAVRDLDLTVQQGETICLIGPSGCGKTTTLRLVNRLLDPAAGRVLIGGVDAATSDPVRLRRTMGYVIQSGGLFPHMTIAANIGLLCELEGWQRAAIEARVSELLDLVHLGQGYAQRYPHELSGGERQRVGVARALALDPQILLMDEPFGALDPITRRKIQDEFVELRERVEKTIIFVTHDLEEAFYIGQRVALMDEGSLVQVGTQAEFKESPRTEFVRAFVQGRSRDA